MYQYILLFSLLLVLDSNAQQEKGFTLAENPEEKKVDVFYNGKFLTAYCYFDSSRKPVLFPVHTVDGIMITRSYPFKSVSGERTDHPHHTGVWLNYESVNGLDFWNNSTAIPVEKRGSYGTIVHRGIGGKEVERNKASLATTASWVRPDGKELLEEQTTFHFSVTGPDFIIDRITTLTATDTTVVFKDVKDGLFAIRVARALELPSKENSKYVDDKGNITTVPPASSAEVSGMYHASNGLQGDSVWGSRAKWVTLNGRKDGREVTVAIIDHPSNLGYPSYWHARGYGLFAVNPLGREVFSGGKEKLNLTLAPGKSVTFRYRLVIHSGTRLTPDEMNTFAAGFTKLK